VKLYVDSLIWAMKHEQPQVGCAVGLWAVSNLDVLWRQSSASAILIRASEDQLINHQKLWEVRING
jgi:hypothetical protein